MNYTQEQIEAAAKHGYEAWRVSVAGPEALYTWGKLPAYVRELWVDDARRVLHSISDPFSTAVLEYLGRIGK